MGQLTSEFCSPAQKTLIGALVTVSGGMLCPFMLDCKSISFYCFANEGLFFFPPTEGQLNFWSVYKANMIFWSDLRWLAYYSFIRAEEVYTINVQI